MASWSEGHLRPRNPRSQPGKQLEVRTKGWRQRVSQAYLRKPVFLEVGAGGSEESWTRQERDHPAGAS